MMQAAESDSLRRPVSARIVSVGSGLVINAGVTELLKHTVTKTRPDMSDRHSFPSRHTSWAFVVSTSVALELGEYSPWWSAGSYAVASAVGYQRVYGRHHFTSDVMSGAGIGIASAVIGRLIGDAVFGCRRHWGSYNYFSPQLSVFSGEILPLASFGGETIHAIFTSGLRGMFPLSDHWGLSATISGSTATGKGGSRLNMVSAMAGGLYRQQISRSLAFEPEIAIGYGRLTETFGSAARNRLTYTATVGLDYRLTPRWSTTIRAGYGQMPVPSIIATIGSTVVF